RQREREIDPRRVDAQPRVRALADRDQLQARRGRADSAGSNRRVERERRRLRVRERRRRRRVAHLTDIERPRPRRADQPRHVDPWLIETSFRLAEVEPTPPAATEVSKVSAVACAFVNAGVAALSLTSPTSSDPVPVALNRPANSTVAVPATCRSSDASTASTGNGIPLWPAAVVSVDQSSFDAPTPLTRFSFSSPSVTVRLSGATANERLIPIASTPSHDFVPWLIETSFSDAEAEPTPPAATEVSKVSDVACAFVNAGVTAASLT